MPESTDTLTITGTSAHQISYGDWSASVNFETTTGDCKAVITSIENAVGGTDDYYQNITINYELENDREGDASIKALYSTGGENGAYSEMTEYSGGSSEGKNNLTTSDAGTAHVFDWDTVTDLGIDFKGTVWVKIRAYDRPNLIGDIMDSQIISLLVDNAPEAPVITFPTSGWFDKNTTQYVTGTIPDPKSGNSNLHIKIEIAADSSFDSIELTLESAVDQVGWEYYDGAAWNDLPVGGIPVAATPALIGETWKATIQTEDQLTTGQKYVRAAAGGILV